MYLLMRRVEGITLKEVIERKQEEARTDKVKFSALMLKIFVQLVTALHEMGKKKVYH